MSKTIKQGPRMDKFSWQGFLFAPVTLTDVMLTGINNSPNWVSWRERFSGQGEGAFDDMRRFLISPIREKFFPLCESKNCTRKTLDLKSLAGGVPWFPGMEGRLATIVWIDLLVLDTFSLLIIKLTAEQELVISDLYSLNRKVPAWFQRYPGDDVAHWRTDRRDKTTLKEWVESELLGLSETDCRSAFGDTDWFGHSLPIASFVGNSNSFHVTADEHFINLLVGAPFDNDSYALCPAESRRLIDDQTLQIYNNWLVGDLNNRILFYSTGDNYLLLRNIESYYIYIAAVVFYQKIMLTYFLEKFIKGGLSKECIEIKYIRKYIRKYMLTFRRNYLFNKISTYYLGDKIYNFFSKIDDVQLIIDRLTQEVEASDDYERLLLERRENINLNLIAVFAAITLPITIVGTIYGIDDKYIFDINSSFWLWSVLLTVLFLVVFFISKYFYKKKSLIG